MSHLIVVLQVWSPRINNSHLLALTLGEEEGEEEEDDKEEKEDGEKDDKEEEDK